jgi:hypothetical protein
MKQGLILLILVALSSFVLTQDESEETMSIKVGRMLADFRRGTDFLDFKFTDPSDFQPTVYEEVDTLESSKISDTQLFIFIQTLEGSSFNFVVSNADYLRLQDFSPFPIHIRTFSGGRSALTFLN